MDWKSYLTHVKKRKRQKKKALCNLGSNWSQSFVLEAEGRIQFQCTPPASKHFAFDGWMGGWVDAMDAMDGWMDRHGTFWNVQYVHFSSSCKRARFLIDY